MSHPTAPTFSIEQVVRELSARFDLPPTTTSQVGAPPLLEMQSWTVVVSLSQPSGASASSNNASTSSLGSLMRTGSAEIQGSVLDMLTDIAARSTKPRRRTTKLGRTCKAKRAGEEKHQKKLKKKRSQEEDLDARKPKRQRAAETASARGASTTTTSPVPDGRTKRRRQRDEKTSTKRRTARSSLKKTKKTSSPGTAIDDSAVVDATVGDHVPALVEPHRVMLEHAESMEILDALHTLERLVVEGVVAPPVGQQVVDEELEELRLQQFARAYAHQAEDDVLADLVSDSPSTSPTVSRHRRGSNPSEPASAFVPCLLQAPRRRSYDFDRCSSSIAVPMAEDHDDSVYEDEEVLCSSYDLLPSVGDDSEY